MKVGDLITWRKPNRRGERDPKGYGLIINTDMMGHLGEQRLWLIVKWFDGQGSGVVPGDHKYLELVSETR